MAEAEYSSDKNNNFIAARAYYDNEINFDKNILAKKIQTNFGRLFYFLMT